MKPRRRPATPAESAQALAQLHSMFAPLSRRMKAERAFEAAKAGYTDAALALSRQDKGAGERADAALASLNAARAELAALEDA